MNYKLIDIDELTAIMKMLRFHGFYLNGIKLNHKGCKRFSINYFSTEDTRVLDRSDLNDDRLREIKKELFSNRAKMEVSNEY